MRINQDKKKGVVSAKARASIRTLDFDSIGDIRDFLIAKFGGDPDFPEGLKQKGSKVKKEKDKLK